MTNLATRLAGLPETERRGALLQLSPEELSELEYAWEVWARPEQLRPLHKPPIWLIKAGRAWGKTRTGAETIRAEIESGRHRRVVVVGATSNAIRRDLCEGPSGLLEVARPSFRPVFEPSSLRLRYPNGAQVDLVTAEEPDRARGLNCSLAWLDEFSSYQNAQDLLDMILLALRIPGPRGDDPWMLITSTPKPIPAMRKLLSAESIASGRVHVTSGSTFANAANLAQSALDSLKAIYGGTRVGRQELDGDLLTDMPGALWTHDMIEKSRVREAPDLRRICIGVDPAGSSSKNSDETGIVAVGVAADKHLYVLRDHSGRYSPQEWARRATSLYEELRADCIVVEKNFGGEMVEATLKAAGSRARIKTVTASRGKAIRAEPIVSLYEQQMVHHVGALGALEDQLTSWSPTESSHSPDRLDALVWACTHLSVRRSVMDIDWGDNSAITPIPGTDGWRRLHGTYGSRWS